MLVPRTRDGQEARHGLIAAGEIRSAVTAAALMLLRDRRPGDT